MLCCVDWVEFVRLSMFVDKGLELDECRYHAYLGGGRSPTGQLMSHGAITGMMDVPLHPKMRVRHTGRSFLVSSIIGLGMWDADNFVCSRGCDRVWC